MPVIKKPSSLPLLSFSFVFIIIATSAAISFISLNNEKKTVENLATQLQVQIFVNIREKLDNYLAMPHSLNRLNADILAQNPALMEDLEGLRSIYIRQLKAFETLGTLAVGIQKQGNYVGVGRREDEFFSSGLMNRDRDSTYRVSLLDSQGRVIRQLAETPDYDARIRPWYKTAAESGKAAWSPVYIWAAGTDIGITAVLPVYDTAGSLTAVQQSALTLGFVSSFIQELRMEKSVQVFLAEPGGMLVASSDSEKVIRKGINGFERIQAVESSTPFIRAASAHLMNQFGSMGGIPANYHIKTEIDGQSYFIAASALNDPRGLNWILITGLSESDVLAQINSDARTTVLLCIIVSLAAVWTALVIARRLTSLNRCLKLEIAERRQAEEAVRESEEQFRAMFESHYAVMMLFDPENGKIIRVNSSAEKYYGYSSEQFADMTIFEINLLEKEKIEIKMANAKNKKRNCFHFPHKLANGEIRDVEVHSSPIPFKGKTILFSIIYDITDRRRAENYLRESEERYRKAQALGHVGNWEYNLQTNRFWGSDEAKRIYGFDVNADSFTADEVESCIPEKDRVHQALNNLIENSKEYNLEFEIIAKDTKKRKTIVSVAELERDEDGCPLKVSGVIHDITERKRVEQELRISLEKYRVLFESFPIGVSVMDADKNLLEANHESEKLLGISLAEHTGRKIDSSEWKIICPSGTPMPAEEYPGIRALKTGQVIKNVEMGIVKENQETTWINVHAAPIPLEEYGVIITYHDITGRKRAEESLRESEEKFHKAFHASPVVMSITSLDDGIFMDVNSQFLHLTELTREEVIGHKANELNMWQENEREGIIREMQKKGFVHGREVSFITKSGKIFPLLWYGDLVHINNRPCLIVTGYDLTERKRVENALRESNEYLENLFNHANAPIIVWDSSLRITRFNRAFERVSGYDAAEVISKKIDFLFPADKKAFLLENIQKTAKGEKWEILEIEILRKDGKIRTVLWNSANIFDKDGKTIAATIAQGQDITKRKHAEEELRHAKEAAESATRAKSEFLASMSHEIRTPMNVIVNMSELLLETELNSGQSSYARMVSESSGILLALINDILDFSKI
ncbi:MAG: PAS domain S-box protein, partial [Desulfococcaceae bacterium]|nr:PAS domain S-box protein [Desulfococcaceae bacterium]